MKFNALVIENLGIYKHMEFSFGVWTKIFGHNGAGKSTLAEAIVWCLFGTDIHGKTKQDERLMRLGAKNMSVTLTVTPSKGKSLLISRTRSGKRASIQTVNGAKPKPGQIEGLFGSVEEFLSSFWPGYFSTMEPRDAKTILSRCVPLVDKEDVLKRMKPTSAKLVEHDQFAVGIDSVEIATRSLREKISKADNQVQRLTGQVDAYTSLIQAGIPELPQKSVTPDVEERYTRLVQQKAMSEQMSSNQAQRLDDLLQRQISLGAAYRALRDSLPQADTHCHTCRQTLPPDKAEAIRREVGRKRKASEAKMMTMLREGQGVKTQIESMKSASPTEEVDAETAAFLKKVEEQLKLDRTRETNHAAQVKYFERAKTELSQTRERLDTARNDLESMRNKEQALKEFRFEYILLQNEEFNGRFDKVHIQLIDANKETGEIRETFRIEWNNLPYRVLSFSEQVRCDLEIGRVLSQVRGEIIPVFVDNAESVQNLFSEQLVGQTLAAYVAEGELAIEIDNASHVA